MRQAVELNKDGDIVGVIMVQDDADIDRVTPSLDGLTLVVVPPDELVRVMGPKGEKDNYHIVKRDPNDVPIEASR